LKKIKDECSPSVSLNRNPARSLASELLDKLPIIYGEYNFTDIVAMRWKQQLNENAKTHCYCDLFPELVHNEIEALAEKKEFNEIIMLLRDSIYEHEVDLQGKINATKEVVQQHGGRILEFWSEGNSELARLLSLTYFGDLTSIYLAIAKSVDPSSIPNIEFVKRSNFMQEMISSGQEEITK
jgi:glucose/mannose-6-phosphate isomerase